MLCTHFLACMGLAVAVAIHGFRMSARDIDAVLIPCLLVIIITI